MNDSAIIDSPIGKLYLEAGPSGLKKLQLLREDTVESSTPMVPVSLQDVVHQLNLYFAGLLKEFNVKLDFSDAPEFHKEVWKMIKLIPYGKTRSYADIAEAIENPAAVRAVGHAVGSNPFPIILPCHRVIGKDGSLTGFIFGLEVKKSLLHLENPKRFAHQVNLQEELTF